MFLDKDNDGKTYYFRGAVTDNYVAIDGIKEYSSNSVCAGGKSMNKPTELGSYSNAVSACNSGFDSYAGYESPDACVTDIDCSVYTIGTSTNKVSKIGTYYDAYNACNNGYSNYGYSSSNECLEDLVSEDSYAKTRLWRIIRINGDGTIRLIANSTLDKIAFNSSADSEEYVGYTYKTRTGYEMGERASSEGTKSISSSTGYYYADEFTFDSTNGGYTLVNPVLHTGEECNNNKSLCERKYTQFSSSTSKKDALYQVTTVESATSIKY